MSGEIQKRDSYTMAQHISVGELTQQVSFIQEVMKGVMHQGEHFGVIPGTGSKPSLLKPGAEKLAHVFQLAPSYKVDRYEQPGDHREYEVVCEIHSIATGDFLGAGVGNCSTKEAKYRYRKAERVCPECGKPTIIKGKQEYGGGWICFTKKGGCGAKFHDDDEAITGQNVGRVEHDNPADYYNTVKKIAKKRAFVDAVLTVTAASDIFTQDIEDLRANGVIDAEFCEAPGADPLKIPPKAKKAAPKQKPKQGGNPATTQQLDAIGNICKDNNLDANKYVRPDLTYEEAGQIITDLGKSTRSDNDLPY
jgi:hypothetical protein